MGARLLGGSFLHDTFGRNQPLTANTLASRGLCCQTTVAFQPKLNSRRQKVVLFSDVLTVAEPIFAASTSTKDFPAKQSRGDVPFVSGQQQMQVRMASPLPKALQEDPAETDAGHVDRGLYVSLLSQKLHGVALVTIDRPSKVRANATNTKRR